MYPRNKLNSNKHFPIKKMTSTCTPDDFFAYLGKDNWNGDVLS